MLNPLDFPIAAGPFAPTVESLATFQCPDWFRDAKFGIWAHWGPQSVPMFGDWYARSMYLQGNDQYRYHCRKYGHPSKFGYKDILQLWKAENFDPAGLMDLFVESGAKYFVAQAMHHDNFDNFDSKWNEWNSTKIGPRRDICAEFQREAKRCGLPFGLTEHLAASYTWFATSHGADKTGPYAGVPYDGADPRFASLYRENDSETLHENWYTLNEKYHQDWLRRMTDVIEKFAPDLFYSDGEMPFHDYGFRMVAHLYNTSAAHNGGVNNAVYNFKQQQGDTHHLDTTPGITKIGVLDYERGTAETASAEPWQDDTAIGDWFYDVRAKYKSVPEITDTLVDAVAKNGNLLLSFPQKPDGTIDDETLFILKNIGVWCKQNGDGIYGTRPYKKAVEGTAKHKGGAFQEGAVAFTSEDFRFTRKGNTIYAFQMRESSEGRATIKTLGRLYEQEIVRVTIGGQPVQFAQKDGALLVETPANPQPGLARSIACELAG
ncbi:MAG: alpha-L-fucosidase [Oscillospiraceae bacterium]|jgi:alpha-L-fucosidase|nr:alpha-L-fucosidase [Oscillospiraceae bacterium]